MNAFQILYQDEFLVAIDKPHGFLVHPVKDAEEQKWIAMKLLRDQLGQKVYPVHRLDRPTSGVLLFALNSKTASIVQQAFARREVEKIYLAVVEGIFPEIWKCETPIQETAETAPQNAITSFERLMVHDGEPVLSLVKAKPLTGRFHQIRRHLCEGGFPIVGDYRYAGMDHSDRLGEALGTGTRMLLQAKSLELCHPVTGEILKIEAPVDADFLRCFPRLAEN